MIIRLVLLSPVLVLLLGRTCPATTVRDMGVQELCDRAADIVVARVERVESRWMNDPRRIESTVTLVVASHLKGGDGAGARVTLRVPGGRVGSVRMRLAGAPRFEPGQRWILFIPASSRTFPTVGIGQGALQVRTGADGVDRVFTHDGLPVHGIDAGARIARCADACNTRPPGALRRTVPVRAENVRVRIAGEDANVASENAVALDAFVAQLRVFVERSPAPDAPRVPGVLEPAEMHAVPLRRASEVGP